MRLRYWNIFARPFPFLKTIFGFFALFSLALCAFAQSGTLLVKALSDDDGSSLDKAQVTVIGAGLSLKAFSENGVATFNSVPSGSYKIEVSAPGFDSKVANPELDYSKKPSFSGSFRLVRAKSSPAQTQAVSKAQRKPLGVVVKDGSSPVDKEYMALRTTPLSAIETEDVLVEDDDDQAAVASIPVVSQGAKAAPAANVPAAAPSASSTSFHGISRSTCGLVALILLIVIVLDLSIFGFALFLKWRSLGMGAKAVVLISWLLSNLVLGLLLIGSLYAFFSTSKPEVSTAPQIAAPGKGQAPLQAASEEALALASFQNSPDEAFAQRLAGIRERMARDFAARSISGNDAGLYKQAILYADSAATLSPADPKKQLLAGTLYARIANSPDAQAAAVERLEKAYALAPESAEIRLALGEACVRIDRNAEALGLFESQVSENPKAATPELVRAMALCYMKERLYRRCSTSLGALLSKDPRNDAARIALSAALRMLGDPQAADSELRNVVSRPGAPPEMKAYAAKLLAAWNSGRKGGAQ